MFANLADNYLDQVHVILPCVPGHKVPGKGYVKLCMIMNGWQEFADSPPDQDQIDE